MKGERLRRAVHATETGVSATETPVIVTETRVNTAKTPIKGKGNKKEIKYIACGIKKLSEREK